MSDSSEEMMNYDNDDFMSDESNDEILPSEDDDDDDDNDDYEFENDRFSRFKIELKKDEMASDLEDGEENDDGLPSTQAWGKDKRSYYHTDYIDKDFRSQKQQDEDLAQYEEEEALQIQKRLFEAISEQDLGIDLLIGNNISQKTSNKEKEDEKAASLFPSILSDSQKMTIIKQESPELELLISDFKKYSVEIQNDLEPFVIDLIERKAPSSLGLKFLKLKLLILTNYCTNITFYMSMKCSQNRHIVKDHPIIQRLFTYKKLINELDTCLNRNRKFLSEMKFIRKSIDSKNKLSFVDSVIPKNIDDKLEKSNKITDLSKAGEPVKISTEKTLGDDEKRAITYEMEKNKGLIPKRKREQRNPRVKYRKKFEKAVIRRKGQVREPRKELKKYGGEFTGINVRSVKSVKFK